MGYNKAAREMIRYANRKCERCVYGQWSKVWTRKSMKYGKNINSKNITYFRSRTCRVCGLKDVQTSHRHAYQIRLEDGSWSEWRAGSEHDKTKPFTESYYKDG